MSYVRGENPQFEAGDGAPAFLIASEPDRSKALRVLVADDDPRVRGRLRDLLAEEADLEIVAECGGGAEVVEAIRSLAPDLVLLDAELPGIDGFGIVAEIGETAMPPVVFLADVDRHAARAFEVGALDYVMKPLHRQRLKAALLRAKSRVEQRRAQELCHRYRELLGALPANHAPRERLALRSQRRIVLLDLDELDWIDASGNYVQLHTRKASHRLRATMAAVESRLDPRRFVRIHRSAIVNLDRVEELVQNPHGDYAVVLAGGTALPLGRSYRGKLSAALAGPFWVTDGDRAEAGNGAAAVT